MARKLSLALDNFEKQAGSKNAWFKPSRDVPTALLLVDRSSDALSPLVHEYTYQAMVNDLLPIQGERYTYMVAPGGGKDKVRLANLSR